MDKSWFVFGLVTAAIWSLDPILAKAGLKGGIEPSMALLLRSLGVVFGTVLLLLAQPGLARQIGTLPLWPALALAAAGFVGSIVGQMTNMLALKAGDVTRVVPLTSAWPAATFLLCLLIPALGETVTLRKALGVAMVLGGILLTRTSS